MPIYEYRCERCGHRFERWQKMSDPDPRRCPECKAARIERLISPVGFRLKGGGWYETDFKQSHRHNVAGDGEAPGGKNESTAGGAKDKSSDKPAPKKDSVGADGGKKGTPAQKGDAAA
ncbi:MAG: FmdB family zinc ribbon protein [Gammaproteobacteria bacterium]